jgi:DNA-3-methyladenine glycosylase
VSDILTRKFYNRETLDVAKGLLGCYLVRKIKDKEIRAKIIDVEAYIGEDDLACHASKGRTPRSETLYNEGGTAYVYLIYGMYHIFNIVADKKDFPAGIMVRAVEIERMDFKKTNGPGKVCLTLKIDRKFNNLDLTKGNELWVENGKKNKDQEIFITKRVGIDYAKHCALYPWRFILKERKPNKKEY